MIWVMAYYIWLLLPHNFLSWGRERRSRYSFHHAVSICYFNNVAATDPSRNVRSLSPAWHWWQTRKDLRSAHLWSIVCPFSSLYWYESQLTGITQPSNNSGLLSLNKDTMFLSVYSIYNTYTSIIKLQLLFMQPSIFA
jgi:hypothetical protein